MEIPVRPDPNRPIAEPASHIPDRRTESPRRSHPRPTAPTRRPRRRAALALALSIALALIAACAPKGPISEAQCRVGDWSLLGERDGAAGHPNTRLLALQEACLTHEVQPDREAYIAGWNTGVRRFCQPGKAFSLGDGGETHEHVCPEDLRADFDAAYEDGRSFHLARVRIADLERDIETKTARLEEVRSELISVAAAQLNPLLTPTRRGELIAELQGLNDEKKRLEGELPELQQDLRTQTRALDERMRDRVGAFSAEAF